MSEIVWLEDVSQQPYVRVLPVYSRTRRGRISYHGHGRAVGYENLSVDVRGVGGPYPYLRRVFWLAPWDPYGPPGRPVEAVDPQTLERVGPLDPRENSSV